MGTEDSGAPLDEFEARLDEINEELLLLEEEEVRTEKADILSRMRWNPTQWKFLNTNSREALFSGANQIGKSTAARGYIAYHATGRYPPNWEGHKWDKPIRMAVLGKTREDVRDIIVKELIGTPDNLGSGYIPKEDLQPFENTITYHMKKDFHVSEIRVRHHTNGVFDGYTTIHIWTYGQGAMRPQGYPLEEIVQDEEPEYGSDEIHAELIARTNFTKGYYKCVMSPTNGATKMWQAFADDQTGTRDFIPYSVWDATHLSMEDRQEIVGKWAGHIQESARVWGMAVVGEGVVYPVADSEIKADEDFHPSLDLPRVIGLDFPHTTGAFAAALLSYDAINDVVYLEKVYKEKEKARAIYAEKLRSWGGTRIPIEWPHDGGILMGGKVGQNSTGSREQPIADYYRGQGLNMATEPAHYRDSHYRKTNAVIPVIEDIFDRMKSGRFKVCDGCREFLLEKTTYRWKDGRPFKSNHTENDIIDAVHKAMMRLLRGEMSAEHVYSSSSGVWAPGRDSGGRGGRRGRGSFFSQRKGRFGPMGRIPKGSKYRPGDEFLS